MNPAQEALLRTANFELTIAAYDPKELLSAVDFTQHRFVSMERDALSQNHYAKGHASLRAACDHLARATEEGEPYVPEFILDLDTAVKHELDVFVFVTPKSVDAVAVMMPRSMAARIQHRMADETAVFNLFKQAIDRR